MSIPEFTYGDRVRRVRLDTGLTQDEFAEQVGVTQAVISRHEKLDAPPSRNTRSLALLIQLRYDVPANWTLTGTVVAGAGFEPATSGLRADWLLAA